MKINWTSEHTTKRQPGGYTPNGAMYTVVCALELGFSSSSNGKLGQQASIEDRQSRH